jgi:hypothetical protein
LRFLLSRSSCIANASAKISGPLALMRGNSSSRDIFRSLIREPDRPSTVSACPNRSATVSSRLLKGPPWMTPSLRSSSASGSSGRGSSSAITASASAHALTVGAIGPIESRLYDKGKAPSVGTRYLLGFKTDDPAKCGRRTDRPARIGTYCGLVTCRPQLLPLRQMMSRRVPALDRLDCPEFHSGVCSNYGGGEFTHVVLRRDNCTSGTQAPNHCRINCRGQCLLSQQLRAGARRLAGDIKQIFDVYDCAIKRAKVTPTRALASAASEAAWEASE